MANEYRINSLQADVVMSAPSAARLNSLQAEVVISAPGSARINTLYAEVVMSIDSASVGGRRRSFVSSFAP